MDARIQIEYEKVLAGHGGSQPKANRVAADTKNIVHFGFRALEEPLVYLSCDKVLLLLLREEVCCRN